MVHLLGQAPRSKRILLTNDDAEVAKQLPLWGKGPIVRYWAERGLVHWEDAKRGEYGSMTWQDAAKRAHSISQWIMKLRHEGLKGDEIQRLQKFICDIEPIIKKARAHGGPFDDTAVTAALRRRRLSQIVPNKVVANDPLEFAPARPARNDPHKGIQRSNAKPTKPTATKPHIIVP